MNSGANRRRLNKKSSLNKKWRGKLKEIDKLNQHMRNEYSQKKKQNRKSKPKLILNKVAAETQ